MRSNTTVFSAKGGELSNRSCREGELRFGLSAVRKCLSIYPGYKEALSLPLTNLSQLTALLLNGDAYVRWPKWRMGLTHQSRTDWPLLGAYSSSKEARRVFYD